MSYYAVHKGHTVGIFTTWTETEKHVKGFPGTIFKKFNQRADAEYFVKNGNVTDNVKDNVEDNVKDNVKGNVKDNVKDNVTKCVYEYYNHPHYQPNSETHNVYYDGSATGNGKSNAYGGYGIFIPKMNNHDEYMISSKIEGKATNNIGELNGAIKALELILEINQTDQTSSILWVIYYDSEYSVNVITGKNRASANLELVRKGKKLLKMCMKQHIDIQFKHVYSHINTKNLKSLGNEVVDKLAKNGSKK